MRLNLFCAVAPESVLRLNLQRLSDDEIAEVAVRDVAVVAQSVRVDCGGDVMAVWTGDGHRPNEWTFHGMKAVQRQRESQQTELCAESCR